MSHANLTLPIRIDYIGIPGRLELAYRKELLKSARDREWRFVEDETALRTGPFDLWELREQFLSWPPDDWMGFVAMAGKFITFHASQRTFETLQELLRQALIRPARDWNALEAQFLAPHKRNPLSTPLPLHFDWSSEVPRAIVLTPNSADAIIATIKIDKLRGAEFRVCARSDCKSPPFRVEARQKKFCSPDCAHLVAVRNSRSRAAKAKSRSTTKLRKRNTDGVIGK